MGQNPSTPGEHQNSWDLWMFIPLKMVSIGIDPYPYGIHPMPFAINGNHARVILMDLWLIPLISMNIPHYRMKYG